MTSDEKEYVFKILRSFRANPFSTRGRKNRDPKNTIVVKRRIGAGKFAIEISNNDVILEVEKHWYSSFVLVHNISSNTFAILLNMNPDGNNGEGSLFKIENISEVLEEDGYFQQSLVQKMPLEYNDLIRVISEVNEIKQMLFKRYNIIEQDQRDVK